ncbi:ATP-binding cassette domain-containing protein [Pontibacillus yanchengensis]|uniref:ATP-binding cassette domain-containing protein n=2 Tax=Pontibacillus yanchengensis TaxID=462910 RepID=A0ACC7VG02_9BACI|nr:ABC transporter transmembrane domain-containing protein [Pontibacillus yanchengensis]MYL32503.1 ATP-binding cassette domain-containing protein [Pontibacillus yanchengensis]MYL53084.1 ATP-binding cassette domain-containing protein [Pontibacillus yanchengensis]
MFSVLGKLQWFFKDYWIRYTAAIVMLIFVSAIDIIPPKIIGMAIDAIQFETLTTGRLLELLLWYGLIIVVSYVVSYYWVNLLFGGAIILERKVRSKLMQHFLSMTPTFFGKYRTGDLMARSTNDLKALSMTTGFGILTLVDSTFFMVMIIGVMAITISWQLTLAALIPLPIMALIMNRYGKTIHERFTKAQDVFGDMNDDVLESIRGVRVIRAFVQEDQDEKRFHEMTEEVYDKNVAVAKIDAMFEPTIKILVGISYTIGLGYGASLVFTNVITLGQLVSFNVYLGMLIWPMFAVGELINVMQRGNASLDRVNETLGYRADVEDPAEPTIVPLPQTVVFDKVTFQYPDTEQAQLKNIQLAVQQGETIGVVGKTGAGKTTMFKQLLRDYPGMKGNLSISDISIHDLSLDVTRGWIGYVPQDQILFSKTVRENIQFGQDGAEDSEIERILKLAYLKDDIDNLPQGLDTKVGESGVTLSGGQKQRVSLARALIMNPEILILDDSLSAVDGKTEANIIKHLKRERKDKTTFIAAHRLSAVQHADLIIVLEDGEIVERGTHVELIENKGWYFEQFTTQQMDSEEVSG